MNSIKDINTIFTPNIWHSVHSQSQFSHTVRRGTLAGSPKTWICKEMVSAHRARIEILAQEFFRLIIPHQPETRIAHDPIIGTYFILSEEVHGYQSLPTNQTRNFLNGTYTGLGQALVCAMFLQEIDLKNGNIGLNDRNQVIKIDGDFSFAEVLIPDDGNVYNITPQAIENLPYPSPDEFYAFNWLDLIMETVQYARSLIVDQYFCRNQRFRQEVNEAIHKICLLPNRYIDALVDAHMPTNAARFSDLLKTRRDALRASALSDHSFLNYITTLEDNDLMINHITHMQNFETNEHGISVEEQPNVIWDVYKQQISIKHPDLYILLVQIEVNSVGQYASVANNYINQACAIILQNSNDDIALLTIQNDLQHVCDQQYICIHHPELYMLIEQIVSVILIICSLNINM